MDGIVNGKIEKSAGAIEFKATRSFDLNVTEIYNIPSIEENAGYIKFVSLVSEVFLMKLTLLNSTMQFIPYPGTVPITFGRVGSTGAITIQLAWGSNYISDFLSAIEIGTLS